MAITISTYVKNLGKSLGYIGSDVFASYAPTLTALGKTTKEATQNSFQTIKDFTTGSTSDFSFKGVANKGGEIASNVWKNTIDDIKTGKIYNKERQEALDNEVMKGLGFDFDLDFDLDDWGDDTDIEDSDDEAAKAQVSAQLEGSKAIVNAVDAMGKGMSASINNATVESASYIAASAKEDSLALFNLNKAGYASINQALMNVNETIYNFSKIGEPLTAHMQNSYTFFSKTETKLNEMQQTLKQIEKNTTPVSAVGSSGFKKKRNLADAFTDEGLDFSEIKEGIMENVNEWKDLLSMFGGAGKGTLANGGKNISLAGMMGKGVIEALIPNIMKESIKGLDQSIKYGMQAGLAKIRDGNSGNFIVDTLADFFMPEIERKRKVGTKYEQGPIAWDGVARKALVDVIPTTLLEIYSAITGAPTMRYDYKKGIFVKTSSILADFNKEKRKYVKNSAEDYLDAIENKLANRKGMSQEKKDQMMEEAYKYFEKAFDTGDYNIFTQDHGIDPEAYKIIRNVAIKSLRSSNRNDRTLINRTVAQSAQANADYSNYLKSEEASGASIYAALNSGFNSKKMNGKGSIIGLDEYGHNYYFYLQGIWQFTNYLANNVGYIAGKTDSQVEAADLDSKIMPTIPMVETHNGEKTTEQSNIHVYGGWTEEDDEEEEEKKSWIDKRQKVKEIINKFSDKGKEVVNKVFGTNLTPGQLTSVQIMDSISDSINRMIFGNKDDNSDGLLGYMLNKTKDLFENARDWFTENIGNRIKDWFTENVKERWNESSFVQETKDKLKEMGSGIRGAARRVFFGDTEDNFDNGTAAYGRKITKSGIVTVSEGELIIPSEYNPFYHGATNKASQIMNENRISSRFLGNFALGDKEYFTIDGNPAHQGKNGKWYAKGVKGSISESKIIFRDTGGKWHDLKGKFIKTPNFAKAPEQETEEAEGSTTTVEEAKKKGKLRDKIGDNSIFGILLHAADSVFSKAKETVDDLFDKDKVDDQKKKFSDKLADIIGDIGGAKGDIGAGAVIGGIGTAFLGINPIFGAFMGAGIGFLYKSKTFQDFLFGEEDENGNRKHQKAYDFMMKEVPSIGKGAALGATAGIFMGSPVLGAFLGGATGFMISNEKFQDFLFGEKDENGDRKGGVLANKIFEHIDNTFHNLGNRMTRWLKDLGKNIKDKVSGIVDYFKKKAEDPNSGFFSKLIGGTLNLGEKALKLPFKIAGGITGAIDTKVAKGNLKAGYSTYNQAWKRNMTAYERIQARGKFGLNKGLAAEFNNFDKFLASLKDYDELEHYKDLIEIIKTEPNGSDEQEAAINELINDPKYKEFAGNTSAKKLSKFLKKNASKLGDLLEDESKRKGMTKADAEEAREEKKLSILDRISILVESIATGKKPSEIAPNKFKQATGGDQGGSSESTVDDENHKTVFDAFGNPHQYIKSSQGEWVKDEEDQETGESQKKLNGFFSSITSIPSILTDKLNGIFGNKEEDEEEKSPSWLSKIFDWAKEKISSAKEFFTTELEGIGSIGSILTSVASIALVTNALFGDQNSMFNRILNYLGEKFLGTGKASENSEATNGGPNDNGGDKTEFQDYNGNRLYKDENGVYHNASTNEVYTGDAKRVTAGKDTFITSFRKTNARQFFTGKQTLAGAIIKKVSSNNIIGKGIDAFESGAKSLWDDAVKAGTTTSTTTIENGVGMVTNTVDDAAIAAFRTNLDDIFTKLAKWVVKIPFVGEKIAASGTANQMFDDVYKALDDYLPRIAGKLGPFLSKAIPVLTIVMMVTDFVTGWEDARSTLGITKNPTVPQRALAGFLRLLKNLIPFIGPLIPDSFVMNILAKYIAPIFNVDTSQLLKDQEEAQAQVEEYNAKYGTNYDVAEYNKAVLHDYTFTERIGNSIKTTWQQTKDNWSAIKSSFTDAGGGIAGISAGIKTAFDKGLPGIFGELVDKQKEMFTYAAKGELGNLWSVALSDFSGGGTNEDGIETAVPSIFSKAIGEIPLVTYKFLYTPFALMMKAGSYVKNLITGNGKTSLFEGIQNIGTNISDLTGFENAIRCIAEGNLKDLWTYSSADADDNGFVAVLKILPTIPMKFAATVPAIFSKVGHIVWDNVLEPIVNKVVTTNNNFSTAFKDAFLNEVTGKEVSNITEATDDEGNPLSGFQKAVMGFGRIAGGLGGIFYKAAKIVGDKVSAIFKVVKNTVTVIGRTSTQLAKSAFTGDPSGLWSTDPIPDDDNDPINGFAKAVIVAEKLAATPISALTWVGKKAIVEPIAAIIGVTKTTINSLVTRSSQLQTYADSGDFSGLWSDTLETEDGNPIGGFAKAIDIGSKLVMSIPTGVHFIGGKIHDVFKAIKDTTMNIATTYSTANNSMSTEALKGNISGIWGVEADYGNGPLATIMGAATIGGKLMHSILAVPFFIGDKIKSAFDPVIKTTKSSMTKFKTYVDDIMKYGDESDIDKIASTNYESSGGIIDGVFSFASGFIKTAGYLKSMFGWVGNKLSDVGENIWDAAKNSSVGKKVSQWFGTGESSSSGTGSGLAINGTSNGCSTCNTAFQSQLDPRYKDISFAGSTVGDSGCGPAVATMASATMGGNLDMNTAINKAKAYSNREGTSTKYFEDVLNASPLKSTSVVKDALESGRPVILLGQDPTNKSKQNSPFGPNNHYVLATGMKNGKVLVNDPESNGPKVYNQSILNKSRYNLTYGGSSRRRGRGGFDASSTDAQQIWAYLTTKQGYTPQGAAGLMGCWAEESSLNPNTIEGFYLSGYPGDEAVRTTSGLNDYTTNVLFPAYSGKNINKSAYKGSDGNYYPGFGLAQWTGTRGQSLHEYSNTSGSDWWSLDNQLAYFSSEMAGSYASTDSKLKSATDVDQATKDAMTGYEGNTSSDYLSKRKPWANSIYDAFKDSKYTYDGSASSSSSSSSSSSDSDSDSSSSSGGLLSVLSSIFGSLGNIFNLNGFSMNDTGSSSSGYSKSTGVGNAQGAQAAANAASNEIDYAESGDNITKFGEWSGCNGQPWCAAFAAWAIAQAFDGSKDKAVKALYNCDNVNYTPTLTDTFKANNAWFSEPEVGDEVMYGNPGPYHVGLVTKVDKNAGTFESVEGNSSDKVQLKSHSGYLEGNVIGFGRPDYTGATNNVAYNGTSTDAVNGDDTDFKATGSGLRGGSSGLLRKAAPSRFAYGSMRGQKFAFGGASGISPANRFSSNTALKSSVTKTLSNIKTSLTKSNGNISGIDPTLVADLLSSITTLLNSIANNTAPTEKIYDALTEYIDYVKGNKASTTSSSSNTQVNIPTSNEEIDSNLAGLVSTLAAIARG